MYVSPTSYPIVTQAPPIIERKSVDYLNIAPVPIEKKVEYVQLAAPEPKIQYV